MSAEFDNWFAREILAHEAALVRYLRRCWPNRDDVHDIRQDTYVRAYEAAARSLPAAPKAFLFTIARNLALNQIRHDRHEHREALREIDPSLVLDDVPGIPESLARRQEHELLIQALQHLPERARQVFTLRRIHGLSIKEICAKLNIAEKTAEAHISLAIRRCTDFVQAADRRASRTFSSTVVPLDDRLS